MRKLGAFVEVLISLVRPSSITIPFALSPYRLCEVGLSLRCGRRALPVHRRHALSPSVDQDPERKVQRAGSLGVALNLRRGRARPHRRTTPVRPGNNQGPQLATNRAPFRRAPEGAPRPQAPIRSSGKWTPTPSSERSGVPSPVPGGSWYCRCCGPEPPAAWRCRAAW